MYRFCKKKKKRINVRPAVANEIIIFEKKKKSGRNRLNARLSPTANRISVAVRTVRVAGLNFQTSRVCTYALYKNEFKLKR